MLLLIQLSLQSKHRLVCSCHILLSRGKRNLLACRLIRCYLPGQHISLSDQSLDFRIDCHVMRRKLKLQLLELFLDLYKTLFKISQTVFPMLTDYWSPFFNSSLDRTHSCPGRDIFFVGLVQGIGHA